MYQGNGFVGPESGPKVFISYTRSDANVSRIGWLSEELQSAGFQVWMDALSNPAGIWEVRIEEAINDSDYFIPCFCWASQVKFESKKGSVQILECRQALDRQLKTTNRKIFILPCRFEEVPQLEIGSHGLSFKDFNHYDLFGDNKQQQIKKLISAMGGPLVPSEPPGSPPPKPPPSETGHRFQVSLNMMGITDGTTSLEDKDYDRFACLHRTGKNFSFMGAFGTKWLREGDPLQKRLRFFKTIEHKRIDPPKIRFLLGNPLSRGMVEVRKQWVNREKNEYLEEPVKYLKKWKELQSQFPNVLEVRFYSHPPNFRLTFCDQFLVFSYYIIDDDGGFGRRAGWELPQLICEAKQQYGLYSALESYFSDVWDKAYSLDDILKFNSSLRRTSQPPEAMISLRSSQPARCVGSIPAPIRLFGRTEYLEKLKGELMYTTGSPLVISSGFGGVGKSSAAAAIVHIFEASGPFGLVVWLDLQKYSEAKTFKGIVEQAKQLSSDRTVDIQLSDQDLIDLWRDKKTLVIFDNYETMIPTNDDDNAVAEERKLRNFIARLPQGDFDERGCIRALVTTRKNVFSPGATRVLTMEKLCEEDSVQLITALLENIGRPEALDPDQKHVISKRLQGLPKYIEMAAGVLIDGDFEHLTACMDERVGVGKEIDNDIVGISWQHLSDQLQLVMISACLFYEAVPDDALRGITGLDRKDYLEAIERLKGYYLKPKEGGFLIHALVREFLKTQLLQPQWEDDLKKIKSCFAQYFLNLVVDVGNRSTSPDVLTRNLSNHLDNIGTAVQYAFDLKDWETVKAFYSEALWKVLESLGRWVLWLSIMEKIVFAADRTSDKNLAAKCRIFSLTWVHLRHERLEEALRYATEGLNLYEELNDQDGIAQAIRHLGKIELLKGEYDEIYGKENSSVHFQNAHDYYTKATHIYSASDLMQKSEMLANMRLDFGRLYWLQGRKLSKQESLEHFDKSQVESLRARDDFRKMYLKAGEAKALGNLGNTTKEIAIVRWDLKCDEINPIGASEGEAVRRMLRDAARFYRDSLKLADKKAEVAHAHWGLAECYELLATIASDEIQRHAFNGLAHIHAGISHREYDALGGGRDIVVTGELEERLKEKLERTDTSGLTEPSDFYCRRVLTGKQLVDIVRETPRVLAFHHTNPSFPVHIMVIPRQHVHSIIEATDEELLCEMMEVARGIMDDVEKQFGGCRLTTNIGNCRETPHLHWHIYAGSPEMIRNE